jgi:hypothetical protein
MTDTVLLAVLALAAGYVLGRVRPAHRVSDWAHWQRYSRARRGVRWWAARLVLSAENLALIALLALHPVKTARAWRHRNETQETR